MTLSKFEPPPGTKVHPYLATIPMMTEDEFAGLVWSIKRIGLIDPISRDKNGVILDGRCRLMACIATSVEPRHRTVETDDPEHFIVQMNILRMHYDPGQKAMQDVIFAPWFSDYPIKSMPEALLVAQYTDLRDAVLKGTMFLGSAHELAVERQKEAATRQERARRLEHLRTASPYLALQVDEVQLSLEQGEAALGQAVAAAEEKAAAPALAEHASAIRIIGKRMIADVIEIGRRLVECKSMLRHGGWFAWLEREFGWTDRTAENFVNVYRLTQTAGFENFSDFDLPLSGLYLLARPSTSQTVREDILHRVEGGEVFSVANIKEAIDEVRGRQPKATSRAVALRDLCDRMAEARPDDPLVTELRRLID